MRRPGVVSDGVEPDVRSGILEASPIRKPSARHQLLHATLGRCIRTLRTGGCQPLPQVAEHAGQKASRLPQAFHRELYLKFDNDSSGSNIAGE